MPGILDPKETIDKHFRAIFFSSITLTLEECNHSPLILGLLFYSQITAFPSLILNIFSEWFISIGLHRLDFLPENLRFFPLATLQFLTLRFYLTFSLFSVSGRNFQIIILEGNKHEILNIAA